MNDNYGFSPDNPVIMESISASLNFMDFLIAANGLHILFHRIKSMPSKDGVQLDYYKITVSDNVYKYLYINCYGSENQFVPPDGFLFKEEILNCSEGYEINNDYIYIS